MRFLRTHHHPQGHQQNYTDVAATEKLVKEYFGGLKNPVAERPRTYATVPQRQKDQSIVVTDKEATNFAVEVSYPIVPL